MSFPIEMQSCLILAQADAPAGGAFPFPVMIVVLVALFWLVVIRPEQKKRKETSTQMEGLKKNDRVVTIGGIYGTVINVQRDADVVTIRIDETTNAKLSVTIGAIARIVTKEKESNE
jgi:preprotein translocase subunit YajC